MIGKVQRIMYEDANLAEGPMAEVWPASPASVEAVLTLPISKSSQEETWPKGSMCRSEWSWIRLANGDLVLATFPQDEGYFAVETLVEQDYFAALKDEA